MCLHVVCMCRHPVCACVVTLSSPCMCMSSPYVHVVTLCCVSTRHIFECPPLKHLIYIHIGSSGLLGRTLARTFTLMVRVCLIRASSCLSDTCVSLFICELNDIVLPKSLQTGDVGKLIKEIRLAFGIQSVSCMRPEVIFKCKRSANRSVFCQSLARTLIARTLC